VNQPLRQRVLHPFSKRAALLALLVATTAGGVALLRVGFGTVPPVAEATESGENPNLTIDQPIGVGQLLEGPRGPDDTVLVTAARMRASASLPGAPEAILALATDLAMGSPIEASRWTNIDPNLFGFVFHPVQTTPPHVDAPHAGGSLAREAVMLGRLDALAAMAEAGLPTTTDGGVLFWGALELWSDRGAADAQRVLDVASKEPSGVDRVHEEGFTAFEMAATVSLDAVVGLIKAGGNPWAHPSDPDGTIGIPSVMERLALHAASQGSLEIFEGVLAIDPLVAPTERVRFNTVGNLADSALAMSRAGATEQAAVAATIGRRIEERFGAVPGHFWNSDVAALATITPTKGTTPKANATTEGAITPKSAPTPPTQGQGAPRPQLSID
jgi:hypothetical protein